MATVPHELRRERSGVAPVVLPITSRGLVLTDRVCWGILGAAMAGAAALILYLNRGTTFFLDELMWLFASPNLSAGDVIEPHNGHLIVTTRLAFKAILETIGADYLAFRLLGVSSVLLSAGVFYALAKRRIGAVPALAPAVVLLLLGSAWQHIVIPIGFTIVFSVAAGLAALLALERGDRRGDLAGCGLLTVSLATYTIGLAFLVGIAVSVLLRPDRRQRAWIFLIPLVLYAAWWLWSLSQPLNSEEATQLSNVLLIPNYVFDSLAAVTAALTGLGYDFDSGVQGPLQLGWGYILAALLILALVLRIRRGNVPPLVWVGLAIVLTYWSLGALASLSEAGRVPWATRYLYTGAVGLLLAAVAAVPSVRLSRFALAALFGAAAFSLATNIAMLRDGAASVRNGYATPIRAEFAMLELARGNVSPSFDPLDKEGSPAGGLIGSPAETYFAAVDRYGSLALPLSELEREDESLRQSADQTLAGALQLDLETTPSGGPTRRCETLSTNARGEAIGFQLPPGGASLRTPGAATPTSLMVGRFGTPSIELGRLTPGEAATVAIPRDSSPRPWIGSVTGPSSVEVCPRG